MIDRLIELSLRHRAVVLALALGLIVAGVVRAGQMPVNVFPDLTAPRVTVVTEATGLASAEVERLITFPIEAAVNGTAGLRRVRSASAPGISVVWAEFDWDTSPTIARQRVTERLQAVSGLPAEAEAPLLAPASSVMGEIMFVAIQSPSLTPVELRRVGEVQVRRRLLGVRGISQVVPIGGAVKQYQVLVDADRAEAYGLTLEDVIGALERGNRNAPGGYAVSGGQESVIRVLGRALGTDDLGDIVIARREDRSIRVRDVAKVEVGAAFRRGAASFNAEPAVLFSIVKQPSADTLSTTRRLDVALDDLEEDLEAFDVTLVKDVFRQQDFIDTAVANVATVLRDGAFLVVAVLFLFLGSFRPTLISAFALPLSLVGAVLVLDLFGFTLDTMTLGGLAIAIGELVDDAIVDVENVSRRLRERAALGPDRPSVFKTVLSASIEVRSAITSATWILMLVFLPLLALDGLEGRLLRPLAVAYLVAIFASLVVAVTVTPVLASWLLPGVAHRDGDRPPWLIYHLTRLYDGLLKAVMRAPGPVFVGAAAVVLAGALGLVGRGRSFLPEFNEGSLTINMVLAPGTALDESDALATMAEQALLEDPGVLSVGRRTGRAERDEHVLGVESTELEVRLVEGDPRTRERLFSDVRERLEVVPAEFTLGQPISHRIEHMVSGQRTALSLKIFGEDLRVLRRIARQVEAVMEGLPQLVDVSAEQIVDLPQLVVNVDAGRAASVGFSRGEAARAIGAAVWGVTASQVYEEGTVTPVVVRYPHLDDGRPEAVERIRIPTPSGALVPISSLATVRRDAGPNYLLRENVERRVVVRANVAGSDVQGAVRAIRSALEGQLPKRPDFRIEYAGQFEREAAASRRLFLFGALALLGIVLIVVTTLGSVRRALIVLVNLPFALAGGVVGVHLAGGILTVATTIGFITLFGIATRSGILLATRVRDLERERTDYQAIVEQAARERLAPILMTAVTAALGLLPLGLALGRPGSEIQAPMALVILTGLVSSTALNMVVVPVLLARFGRGRAREEAPSA